MSCIIPTRPNNIIKLIRGDTFEFKFNICQEQIINAEGKKVLVDKELVELDNLYFGCMEPNEIFENALIRKSFANGDITTETHQEKIEKEGLIVEITVIDKYVLHLNSSDTEHMLPGKYYYSIKLHEHHMEAGVLVDKTRTIIDKTKFILLD